MGKSDDRIKELEDLISNSQYNKRTQRAIGLYKAQLAKLKDKVSSGGKKGKSDGYSVRKTGDATVVLLGFPSVGKSTLLNGLTNANSEVGSYAFTTLKVIPGIMEYNHAKIQILDVPGVVHGAASGKGRGSEVLAVLRSADLIVVLIDVNYPDHCQALLKEVYDSGIRVNSTPPDVKIKKTGRGGIRIGKTVRLSKLSDETIKAILKEFKYNNADVVIRSKIGIDEMIDCIEGNKKYVPSITVLNKVDMVSVGVAATIGRKVKADLLISAQKKSHLDELEKLIYSKLDLMRIYMKEPSKDADMDIPLIIRRDSSVRDVCNKLHKDFVKQFKFCRVWGSSAKFPGQWLRLKHVLKDKDILEIHLL